MSKAYAIQPDLILHNGQVLTMDAADTVASAVAVKNKRIVAVGDEGIANLAGPGTRVIDLKGRTLMPGFVEGHVHAEWYGRNQLTWNFKDCKSREEVLQLLKRAVDQTPEGEWVAGCAIPIAIMQPGESSFTLSDFDSVSPNHPVAIDCASTGHCMWLNSQAMKRLGVSNEHYPSDIRDGDGIVRDGCGCMTGQMEGHAWNWALRAVKPYTFDWYLKALERAQNDFLEVGITAAHSAWEDPYILNGWQTLEREDRLKVRTYLSMDIERYGQPLIDMGIRSGFGSDMLKISQLKVILNVPPRAAMIDDYVTRPGDSGYHLYPPEWVKEKVLHAVQNGWSVCAHSTGDRDTEMLMDAYEHALEWYKAETGKDNKSLRLRLEHTMFITPELIDRIVASDIIVNVRPCGRLSPGDAPGGPHERLLGHDRWSKSRAIKPFLDRGVSVNFGCDYPAPCGFIDPGASLYSALGGIGEPWDVITPMEALRCYTINSAYGLNVENELGSIEAGKFADLAVLSEDPLTLPVERMWDPETNTPLDLKVDCTIVGGQVEYER
ncbi:MAG: amidohydrolase [Hyphomonadaceae bacterium]|nr:amidohydrolase [Hyphomonadaceae bacterium]